MAFLDFFLSKSIFILIIINAKYWFINPFKGYANKYQWTAFYYHQLLLHPWGFTF